MKERVGKSRKDSRGSDPVSCIHRVDIQCFEEPEVIITVFGS